MTRKEFETLTANVKNLECSLANYFYIQLPNLKSEERVLYLQALSALGDAVRVELTNFLPRPTKKDKAAIEIKRTNARFAIVPRLK